MRFLGLLPVLSALVAPSLTAPTPEAASPDKFDTARNSACTHTPPWGEKTDGRIDQFRSLWKERDARNRGTVAAQKAPPPPPPKSKMDKLVDDAEAREHGKHTNPKPYNEMKPNPGAKAPQGAPPRAPQQAAPPPQSVPKRKARNPAKNLERSPRLQKRDEKTDGTIGQFHALWKEREARERGTVAAKQAPPPPPPKSKMDRLVEGASSREHGKYTNPKPYNEMKPNPGAKAPQGTPPRAPQGPPRAPQAAPAKPPQVIPRQKARNPAKGLEISPQLEKRDEGFCRVPDIVHGNKYPDSESFFKFAEENLGVRYNQKDLEAARAKLESSLAAATQRDAERKSDDPPPVQCDDEFLAFAGIQREEVAPPARDEFQHEAQKTGLDRFEGIQLRKTVETEGHEAQEKKVAEGQEAQEKQMIHPQHSSTAPNTFTVPVPVPAPNPDSDPVVPLVVINPVDAEVDVAVVSAETEALILVVEDIRRFIIFYDRTRNDDVIISATEDVAIELNFDVVDPNALNGVTLTDDVNGVTVPDSIDLAQEKVLATSGVSVSGAGAVSGGGLGTVAAGPGGAAVGGFATGLGPGGFGLDANTAGLGVVTDLVTTADRATNGLLTNSLGANNLGFTTTGVNTAGTVNSLGVNGLGVNGLGVSGPGVNGLGVNGLGMNGPGVSGPGVNGLGVNGLGVNGPGVSGLGVNGLGVSGPGVSGPGVSGLGWGGLGVNGGNVLGGIGGNVLGGIGGNVLGGIGGNVLGGIGVDGLAGVGLFPGEAQEQPLDLATAHAQRKQFDQTVEKTGPWCPVSDETVLEFLKLAV
jgi:hypothetical protein